MSYVFEQNTSKLKFRISLLILVLCQHWQNISQYVFYTKLHIQQQIVIVYLAYIWTDERYCNIHNCIIQSKLNEEDILVLTAFEWKPMGVWLFIGKTNVLRRIWWWWCVHEYSLRGLAWRACPRAATCACGRRASPAQWAWRHRAACACWRTCHRNSPRPTLGPGPRQPPSRPLQVHRRTIPGENSDLDKLKKNISFILTLITLSLYLNQCRTPLIVEDPPSLQY